MEKILGLCKQLVSKYRKRLAYGVLAMFIGQICFLGIGGIGNRVFAEETQEQKMEQQLKTWQTSLSLVVKIVYILIYPLLVLAGKLVDNSLVYGEVFGFDAVLWQLWNIVKNLANFTLGFIFIFKIFRYLINGKEKVKDIILRALIAGIGIQASWFLMAALLDISTILTYSVGGLPISVLGDTMESYNPYVLKTAVNVNAKDTDTWYIYLTNTTGAFYISECYTFTYGSGQKEELILAPKMIYYESGANDYKPTDAYRCHYNGQVYYFERLYGGIESDPDGKSPGFDTTAGRKKFNNCSPNCESKQADYKSILTKVGNYFQGTGGNIVEDLVSVAVLLEIGDAHMTGGVFWSVFTGMDLYLPDQKRGLDVGNEWTGTGGNASRLKDILDGRSYVGVFSALYSSLIASGKTTISQFSSVSGLFRDVLNVAFSVLYVLAIAIPLIVVSIVFMMRIGIIWLAIAFSPFIVLFTAFDLFKANSIKKIKLLEYLDLENLIPIIFSPAIICFAISISTVLFIIITNMYKNLGEIKGEILMGLISVKIAEGPVNIAQLVILALGVAITWFIVWAAIETSKLGESAVVQGLKKLTTTALGSMPVIPVPTKNGTEMMGVSTVFGGNGQEGLISRMTTKFKEQYNQDSNDAINALLDPEKEAKQAAANKLSAYTRELGALSSIEGDWTQMDIKIGENKDRSVKFGEFSPEEKEKIIGEINGFPIEKRKNYKNLPSVVIGDKKWEFVKTRKEDGKEQEVYKYEQVKSTSE